MRCRVGWWAMYAAYTPLGVVVQWRLRAEGRWDRGPDPSRAVSFQRWPHQSTPFRTDSTPVAPQFIYVMKALRKVVPPSRVILDDIWLSFYPGAKIGVLGANGAGKSSLLRIMAGVDQDFQGEAWAAKGTKIGYLSQEPQLDPSKNVRE